MTGDDKCAHYLPHYPPHAFRAMIETKIWDEIPRGIHSSYLDDTLASLHSHTHSHTTVYALILIHTHAYTYIHPNLFTNSYSLTHSLTH